MPVDFDNELSRITENLNRRPNGNGKPALPAEMMANARYDFVRLGEEIAGALLQAAEEQVTQAQNMLEQTRAFADKIRADIAAKDAELADMNNRLRAFGVTIIDAHKRFHAGSDEAGTLRSEGGTTT